MKQQQNIFNSSRIHHSHKPLWCFQPSRDRTVTKTLWLFSISTSPSLSVSCSPFPPPPPTPHHPLSLFLSVSRWKSSYSVSIPITSYACNLERLMYVYFSVWRSPPKYCVIVCWCAFINQIQCLNQLHTTLTSNVTVMNDFDLWIDGVALELKTGSL